MGWLSNLLGIARSILDKMPSRKEAIQNDIDKVKGEMHALQSKDGAWTAIDSGNYYVLANKLQDLEKRAKNAGL